MTKMQRSRISTCSLSVMVAAALGAGCSEPSEPPGPSAPSGWELEYLKKTCVEFYRRERQTRSCADYNDHWMKEDKLVISIADGDYCGEGATYIEGLCVVDLEEGSMILPSVFEQQEWQK